MKKNFIAGVIVSLAMVGMFGGVSYAESATSAKAGVTTEAKTEAPVVKKKAAKKVTKKKLAKKVVAKKKSVKTEAAPEAGK